MLTEEQQKNYDFFMAHLKEYLKNPTLKNKYAVFYGCNLEGSFDSFSDALSDACDRFPLEDLIIQQIIDPSEIAEDLLKNNC